MSNTSDSQQYGIKACLSIGMIERLFSDFAQRRFEKNSGTCILRPPSVSNDLENDASHWCYGTGFIDKPNKRYGSISSRPGASPPGDTLLPGHGFDNPVVGHQICIMYNDDPDGVVSRISEKASGALLWTDAAGKYNFTELEPSSDWTKRECVIGAGRYNQKTATSFVRIPSTRGFGPTETACEPCAVSLKRFAEMFHEACTNASIKRGSDGQHYATLQGAGTRPEHPYHLDVRLERAEYLHDKTHKETRTGPCTVPKCKMSFSSVISVPTRRTRRGTRKHSA